jgi:hypothetical protein
LPTHLPLDTGNTKRHYVIEVVATVVVQTVGCQVRFNLAVLDVEEKAATAILADLADLTFKPGFGDEVGGQGSSVFEVLPSLVFNLSCQVFAQSCFVKLLSLSVKKTQRS